ncbi:ATP-binding cassette domain-containing protein [Pseudonocardia alni]|uniref:ATP-binding cassette domain-containing protein n=1 Tax=Pseudonocardia alni TaxID=33907 RepID=UPI0033EB04CA
MIRTVRTALLAALLGVLGASVLSFLLLRVAPGDPVGLALGPFASDEARARLTAEMGIDDPLPVQYAHWVAGVLRGDWGHSYAADAPVRDLLVERLPASVELSLAAAAVALGGAVLLATLRTVTGSARVRRTVDAVFVGSLAVPQFWLALILLVVFSEWLLVLPGPEGRLGPDLATPPSVTGLGTVDALLAGDLAAFGDTLAHLLLPALALGLYAMGFLGRLLTTHLRTTLREPYVEVALARGIDRRTAVLRHALPNALLATAPAAATVVGLLVTGGVLVESAFGWPGVGALVTEAITRQDHALVQAFVLFGAAVVVLANLASELLVAFADPRLRPGGGPVRRGATPAPAATRAVYGPRAEPGTPVLVVRGLTVGYGDGAPAVSGVDLDVAAGEIVALVGASGSGKTTIARTVLGLLPTTATVHADAARIAGVELDLGDRAAVHALRGTGVAYVPQDPQTSLDPLRRVGGQLAEALHGGDPAGHRARVESALADCGLPDPAAVYDTHPHRLSGGMRQRALIASALAGTASLLVADEPTSALDAAVRGTVLDELRAVADTGAGVLFVTHDLAVARSRADRIVVLRDGRVVESGPRAEVVATPRADYTRELLAAAPRIEVREPRPDPAAPAAAPLVRLHDAGIRHPGATRAALTGVDLQIGRGRIVGVVGASGSGKTTLGRLVLGTLLPTTGTVEVAGVPTAELDRPAHRAVRRGVQAIFQDPYSSLDPRFTVAEVLREPLAGRVGLSAAERARRVADALDAVALSEAFIGRRRSELSGGQCQRVAIARALLAEPELIVCDEPTASLDTLVQRQVLDLLTALRADRGVALLLISHDLATVAELADEVVVVDDGRIVEHGPTARVLLDPLERATRELVEAATTG